jgi:hypothetical protein
MTLGRFKAHSGWRVSARRRASPPAPATALPRSAHHNRTIKTQPSNRIRGSASAHDANAYTAANACRGRRALSALVHRRDQARSCCGGRSKQHRLQCEPRGRSGARGRDYRDARDRRTFLDQCRQRSGNRWSRKVLKLARHDAQVRRFMTVPGIGPITALCFKATIDDPTRFKRSRSVGAYVGLTARRHASGEIDWTGRISKCGDAMLRSYLFEAASVLLTRVPKWSALSAAPNFFSYPQAGRPITPPFGGKADIAYRDPRGEAPLRPLSCMRMPASSRSSPRSMRRRASSVILPSRNSR